jgi:hypothetical protein
MRFMMIVIPKGYESAAPDAVPGAEAVAKARPLHLGEEERAIPSAQSTRARTNCRADSG